MVRRRLDAELVRRGLASSRTEAQRAVRRGLVLVRGRQADKPSTLVDDSEPVDVAAPPRRFVSRGGEKLDAALSRFAIAVRDRRCLDAGASTGGFTDRLLQGGAAHVVALDVGYGQLAWTIRVDDRVTVLERTNVRDLTADDLPYAPDLVVADLSFISLTLAVPRLAAVTDAGADLVLLVKPQFEAGRPSVGRGGVVRNPDVWRSCVTSVAEAVADARFAPSGVMASPVRGPAGNVEFLLHAVDARSGPRLPARDVPELDAAIDEGLAVGAAS
ncbi:MAG TPA: TlyA family RNA methyltransferase [Actinomycetota bacterium]|nr:TlyA family RNA methyltransferase [Actinomycetota bacterium]